MVFFSLWRRLGIRNSLRSSRGCPRAGRHLSHRPRLEPLEDRALLAADGVVFAVALAPVAVSSLPLAGSRPAAGTPIRVTVDQNSPETVIDLGAAFGAVSGLQHGDGLRLSILGNTNAGLVRTNLSEAALTLTYAPGQSGTATITVCATDADGVSVKETILVTVRPLSPAGAVSVAPRPAGDALER
jgi:hypothetical protein